MYDLWSVDFRTKTDDPPPASVRSVIDNFLGTFVFAGMHNEKYMYKLAPLSPGPSNAEFILQFLYWDKSREYEGWWIGPNLDSERVHALSPLGLAG